jgi:hypothetical protein
MLQSQRPVCSLLTWLISHQPAVLFSQNKPDTRNQAAVLFSQNKSAPAISHQPNEQAVGGELVIIKPLYRPTDSIADADRN